MQKKAKYLLFITFILIFIYFTSISYFKYRNYFTTSYDLAIYTQAVWGIQHNILFNTVRNIHIHAHHIQPVLYILSLFYRIFPTPVLLLIIQSLFISLNLFIIFYIMKKNGFSPLYTYFAMLCFFLYAPVQNTVFFEFHPGTLAIPFFFLLLYNINTKNNKFLINIICAAVILSTRENYSLIIAPVLIYSAVKNKNYLDFILAVSVISWFFIAIFGLKPHFSRNYFDTHLEYYSDFGKNYKEIAYTLFMKPLRTLNYMFTQPKLIYLLKLFLPLLFLPLINWRFIWVIIPVLCINLLSNHPGSHSVEFHFNNEMIPVIFFSFITVLKKINKNRIKILILSLVFLSSIITSYNYGKLPVSKYFNIIDLIKSKNRRIIYDKYKTYINDNQGVTAEVYAAAHFANRRFLYIYPNVRKRNIWIIYDANIEKYAWNSDKQKNLRKDFFNFVLKKGFYTIIDNKNNIYLLKRVFKK